MIITTEMILDSLKDYANPKAKLSRMAKQSEYHRIIKGLYETDINTPAYLLAGSIYGPSYISFEYALRFYGLIPEAVYTVTSATFNKKKKKKYETAFGIFTYQDVPSSVFPLEIRVVKDGDYYYRIASPEKALCDLLYIKPPVSNIEELSDLIFEDLRIDENELKELDFNIVAKLADYYHSTNVNKLTKLLRRIK